MGYDVRRLVEERLDRFFQHVLVAHFSRNIVVLVGMDERARLGIGNGDKRRFLVDL